MLFILWMAMVVAAVPPRVKRELGEWSPSIKSVETKSPEVRTQDVFEEANANLWKFFWNSDSLTWGAQCGAANEPVVWDVAVAGRAIIFGDDTSKTNKVVEAFANYKSTSSDGYSASTAKDGDIYTDDCAQIMWAFTDAYLSSWDKAKDLFGFLELWEHDDGGVLWSVNGNYIASILTLEAALGAVRLHEVSPLPKYTRFAKKLMDWSFDTLLDPTDKFFYDGIDTSGNVNTGKLTYTVGVAILTCVHLSLSNDTSRDWQAVAVELAMRFMNAGHLNTQFYTNGYINDQLRYLHLLFQGFGDLLKKTTPRSSYQKQAYDAVRHDLVRQARHVYDQYQAHIGECQDGLLDYASLVQVFHAVAQVTDSF